MKTLKVLLQEVVSGIKAWVNSNFAQESNTVHKTGDETINGVKTFTGNVFQNQAGGVNIYCATCDGAVKGDLTSSGTFSIVCKDGSNANMETSGLAAVYMGQDASGSYVALRADTSYNNTRYNASVSLDIDPTTANNNAIFRPRRDNTIDLGSSSYQFKNLYANNYYYKGTAWGLDKSNWWKETQVIHQGEAVDIVNNLSAERVGKSLYFMDANHFWAQYIPVWGTDGSFRMELGISNWTAQGAQGYWTVANRIAKNFGTLDFYTSHPNGNLGTATNPWKTVNGINPGALSLPSTTVEPISTQGWDFANYSPNSFTAPGNGYISVGMFADSIQIANDTRNMGLTATKGSDGYASLNLPCCSGDTIRILIKSRASTVFQQVIFVPALGNV